jgi:thiamine transport system ATP-binding protein
MSRPLLAHAAVPADPDAPAARPMLEVDALTVRFGETVAVAGFDLTVARGEVVALLGPSGCGKTTVLRAVAGLEAPAAGRVLLDGGDLASRPPHRRGFGLMFQDHVLFPHRDVGSNVAFGLRMKGEPPDRINRRVRDVLGLVGLEGYETRRVYELSGGEQQRVALARALAPSPRLLLLDEPLGSVDRTLRDRLLAELRDLFGTLGLTAIYVTHDQTEAFTISDRVIVMRAGAVVQVGSPADVWRQPADAFVARFLGFKNLVPVAIAGGRAGTPWGEVAVPGAGAGPATLVIRPDGLRPVDVHLATVTGEVVKSSFRGDHFLVEVATAAGPVLEAAVAADAVPDVGDRVGFVIAPEGVAVVSS